MKEFVVRTSGALRGSVRVPGDKSVGHRALLFSALASGPCSIRGLSMGLDNRASASALQAMGVPIALEADRATVNGVGLHGLRMPAGVLDCGNSGTTLRMFAGLLVAQRFGTRLVGDESLSRRPMRRIVEPLRARGGHIAGVSGPKPDEVYPPLSVAPLVASERLSGIEYDMPVASAQVKSALLLSGLYAKGPTAIKEPVLSRDHTERMMVALGVPLETAGSMVMLDPERWDGSWAGFEWEVPGDFSSAAFFLAAAHLIEGSEITVEGVGLNPTRTGLLDALRPMSANVVSCPKGSAAGGEPVGELVASYASVCGAQTGGEIITRMIDEVPALCALAASARGRTTIRDASELRVKESDRIHTMCEVLRAFGVECNELPDGMTIEGAKALRPARVRSHGDHRIAMAAALLGMKADGESRIEDVECVDTSFPGFASLMRGLGASIEESTG